MLGLWKRLVKFAAKRPAMTKPTIDNCITEAINAKGVINLDANDFKFFLDNASKVHSFLEIGKGESSLNEALKAVENDAMQKGAHLFDKKKILISIFISSQDGVNQAFATSQLNVLNEFIARFNDGFEIKWGLYTSPDLGKDETKVLLLAC